MNWPEVFQIDECHLFCDSPRGKLQQAKPPETDEGWKNDNALQHIKKNAASNKHTEKN